MRHQAEDVLLRTAVNPGDVVHRSIRIRGAADGAVYRTITERDPVLVLELLEHARSRLVAAVTVRDRKLPHRAELLRERAFPGYLHVPHTALEPHVQVPRE